MNRLTGQVAGVLVRAPAASICLRSIRPLPARRGRRPAKARSPVRQRFASFISIENLLCLQFEGL
jgi:hypothetical protein